MNKLDKVWIISMAIGIFAACVGIKQCANQNAAQDYGIRCDTITEVIFDTVYIVKPVPKDSICVRHDTVRLAVTNKEHGEICDTAAQDSMDAIVPITQKHYSDSLFSVWVSGYNANLDSIRIHQPTRTITITNNVRDRARAWNIGLQAGYGITPRGMQPYVGVGVSCNLFTK